MGFKLVLGTIIGKPYPWLHGVRVKAVMVNAYEILSKNLVNKARGKGLRRILGIDDDVELWIDSGGYQFLKHGVNISVNTIAKIYSSINADYYVSLDYPPSPGDDDKVRASKIAKSIRNYQELSRTIENLVPVYHLSTGKLLRIQYEEYYRASYACIGGLVPYFMQLAGKHSRLKAVVFLALIRKMTGQLVHALGLASPAVVPILRRLGIDSADTMTWRQKAAYGKVIIPGRGERHVSGRKVRFGPKYTTSDDWLKLEYYLKTLNGRLKLSVNDLVSDFTARALFNAWSIQYIAEKPYNGDEIVSPTFRKLYAKAKELVEKSVNEIEEYLLSLLSQ